MPRTRRSRLRFDEFETREVPANIPLLAFGTDAGSAPELLVTNKDTGQVRFDLMAFGPQFKGGVRVAVGDVTGDGQDDVIAATGTGAAIVKVFDGVDGHLVRRFAALAPSVVSVAVGGLLASQITSAPPPVYPGGITVATGDINGDGRLEVITGSDAGGPAVIATYDGRTGRVLGSFYPAGLGRFGVRVAAGDVDGDGHAEIITAAASSSGSMVRVFDGRSHALKTSFAAFGALHKNGLFVAAADVDGDGVAEAVLGCGSSAAVEIRDARTGTLRTSFDANVSATTGIRVGGTVFGSAGMSDVLCGSADGGAWGAYDGTGKALPGGTPSGFATGLWVAGSPEQVAINQHASKIVLDWNAAALGAIRTEKTSPPLAARALAILQTSMFDAVNGIGRAYKAFAVNPGAVVGASMPAAAAEAAYSALVALFPNEKAQFDTLLAASLANVPDGQSKSDGSAWGQTVANSILLTRATDGSSTIAPYTPGSGPGVWAPTPPANAPALLPGWGNVTPFGITDVASFVPAAPPALTSQQYADDFNTVKQLGGKTSADRTVEQTEIANFWADGGGTFTPPGHWNAIAGQLAQADGLSIMKVARMFAQLDVAEADAAIVAWKAKFTYNTWRPITAIQNADTDGNDATVADPSWQPLLTTPPFPSYTSGHSTFSGAASTVLASYFGANRPFSTQSNDGTITRAFANLAEAADEAGMSRIYGGIHYPADNVNGLASGRAIGAYALQHLLQSK